MDKLNNNIAKPNYKQEWHEINPSVDEWFLKLDFSVS